MKRKFQVINKNQKRRETNKKKDRKKKKKTQKDHPILKIFQIQIHPSKIKIKTLQKITEA